MMLFVDCRLCFPFYECDKSGMAAGRRYGKRVGDKDGMAVRFKGQAGILIIICIFVFVMELQEFEKGHRVIFLLMRDKMLHQYRQAQELACLCRRKHIHAQKKYNDDFFQKKDLFSFLPVLSSKPYPRG